MGITVAIATWKKTVRLYVSNEVIRKYVENQGKENKQDPLAF